ncbi:MAG: transposase, partial [Romboutsia sp.]
ILMDRSKKLRKVIYDIDEIDYCQKLIDILKETLEDDIEHLKISQDIDAKVGHKSVDTSFFGYKTHIAMTKERIITAETITTGEKNDGKELQTLVDKSIQAGIKVESIIGDSDYSEKGNIEYSNENNINLIAKLNPSVTQGFRKKEDEFEFNKDAGMYVCKEGHMAIKKARQAKKGIATNQVDTYYFDIEKCKICAHKNGCYKEGAKSKTYSVTIKSDIHLDQISFQESNYFKEKSKERYKIEAKNSELKHRHGYDVSSSSGLIGMEMQGALTIFTVNLKRILKLINEK